MNKDDSIDDGSKLRWFAVTIFMIVLIPIILVPLYMDLPERIFGPIIAAYSLGGAALLIYIMIRPYLKRRSRAKSKSIMDDYEPQKIPSTDEVYHERITMKAFIFAFLIAAIVMSTTIFFVPDVRSVSFGMIIVLIILIIVGYFFRALDVKCDNKHLSFHFGPFGKDVPIKQIKNIEVTNVRPLKDFMGWGHRIGPDGSIGYIAAGNKGVKIDLKNSKAYVLTVRHPKRLVKHVEEMKEKYY